MRIILNKAALDFMTATTYEFQDYQKAVWDIVPEGRSGKRGSFLQYKGDRYENIFHGQAEQRGHTHYLVQLSGGVPFVAYHNVLKRGLYPSRLDMQITISKPTWYSGRELADSLSFGIWPGEVRQVSLIESPTGSTVYIGDRTHDRYIRVYEKDDSYVRFEVEFKKDRARMAAKMLLEQGENLIPAVLNTESRKIPPAAIMDEFRRYLYGKADVKVSVVEAKEIARVRWLGTLLPTIRKMMNNDAYGHMVTGWFVDLIEEKMKDEN